MQISEQLIQRVLTGNATPAEKEQVAAYFRSNPEQLAQYMTDESWDSFEPLNLQQAPKDKILSVLENNFGKASVRHIWYRWAAAAAAAILIAGTAAYLYLMPGKNDKMVQVVSTSQEQPMEILKNLTASVKEYTLSDGSTVKLTANSIVRFHQPFIDNRRDIYLIGEATFKVAKDKTKPFVVHSSHITTTALGTVFSVNDKQNTTATIHLYEGKIVIKSTDSISSFKDVYLTPGQELVLSKIDFSTRITTAQPKTLSGPSKENVQPVVVVTVLQFNKTTLSEVFSQLEEKLNVHISYNVSYVTNMDFTGTFDSKKESLASFLGTLCDLNELKLVQTNSKSFSIEVK